MSVLFDFPNELAVLVKLWFSSMPSVSGHLVSVDVRFELRLSQCVICVTFLPTLVNGRILSTQL